MEEVHPWRDVLAPQRACAGVAFGRDRPALGIVAPPAPPRRRLTRGKPGQTGVVPHALIGVGEVSVTVIDTDTERQVVQHRGKQHLLVAQGLLGSLMGGNVCRKGCRAEQVSCLIAQSEHRPLHVGLPRRFGEVAKAQLGRPAPLAQHRRQADVVHQNAMLRDEEVTDVISCKIGL